jgi:DNA primase small subunit
VTCDVKRLIRLPFSLHGKTGFKVTPISLEKMQDFNPLRDTVVLSEEKIKIIMNTAYAVSLKNQDFSLDKGSTTVPIYVAVFLLGRRLASLA